MWPPGLPSGALRKALTHDGIQASGQQWVRSSKATSMARAGGEHRVPAQPCHHHYPPVVPFLLLRPPAEPQGGRESLYRAEHPPQCKVSHPPCCGEVRVLRLRAVPIPISLHWPPSVMSTHPCFQHRLCKDVLSQVNRILPHCVTLFTSLKEFGWNFFYYFFSF